MMAEKRITSNTHACTHTHRERLDIFDSTFILFYFFCHFIFCERSPLKLSHREKIRYKAFDLQKKRDIRIFILGADGGAGAAVREEHRL